MAETFRVNIEFNPQQEKLLIIPEEIKVPQYSVIQWNIIGLDKYFEYNWRKGFIFTIYFNEESPFLWKRQFVQIDGNHFFHPIPSSRLIRLAEDVAEKKGDYKYGVRVSETENDETLFDEDPYIKVV